MMVPAAAADNAGSITTDGMLQDTVSPLGSFSITCTMRFPMSLGKLYKQFQHTNKLST